MFGFMHVRTRVSERYLNGNEAFMAAAGEKINLDEARKAIDDIDREMARLFAERMSVVRGIAFCKHELGLPVYDSKRENEVLERNVAYVSDELAPYYRSFQESVMEASRRYQLHLMQVQ